MNIKVLYVEDELFLGKIVKETLETRGFEVIMESDGADVVRSFEDEQPDICILDVMLPNRSGFELAEDIRKQNDDVPIIFLTAKTQTDDVVHGFRLGANDYIRKPFSMEELIVRIENALKVKKEEVTPISGDAITIGKYQFHLNKQVLGNGKEERRLSYRESELLKYLYQNRNMVIDRRELLNHIWGNDSFFNSRNLDVYVTKIRGYLREDPAIEIITIKGVGYRFVV
ncbi:response regulator transcription factor [Sediminibacterium ginsengisoli]|uniref:DNA-binding response regulator, OmpR family, contains REC and winged-helix (WHTH) domain n=1 Tax=Sediminibacterium ginsengisoli TaxID=413434 RepID=A0A1T4LWY8_9BACT|nr:response regulator transcription factor [Sediminibacterium ginsengisoli]SJZ58964.1 DNA-binding response regulator, OmpR family, contains REC and winged-helix (wHTH) domain [Sediminibacterium ginsengisoli]